MGLTDSEIKIFKTLVDPKNITDLSVESGIPRTSLNYIIKGMVSRGMVSKIKVGKRYHYQQTPKEKLSESTDALRVFFDPSLSVLTSPSFGGLRVYKGVASIISLHEERLSTQPKHSRVKVIQPTQSFLHLFDTASIDQIISLNKAISNSGVILDGVVEKKAYDAYREYWKVDPESYERLNPTFLNRTTDYVEVETKLPFVNELWIYFDSVVISNWKDGLAVVITNQETRGLLEVLYDTLKETGNKVDHAEEINKRIK